VPLRERQAFYAALGRPPDAVFPLRYAVVPSLAIGFVDGEVAGFYQTDGDDVEVES
jgi:hypothetical protein